MNTETQTKKILRLAQLIEFPIGHRLGIGYDIQSEITHLKQCLCDDNKTQIFLNLELAGKAELIDYIISLLENKLKIIVHENETEINNLKKELGIET
jgi:hypothetical protein